VGIGGAGEIGAASTEESSAGQSVRAQFGDGGGARKIRASTRSRMVMWSDPVEGRGSLHSAKYRVRRGQAKARSRTPGRPMSDMENGVKTPGVFRRENPSSVALSKQGVEVASSSSLNVLRGSADG